MFFLFGSCIFFHCSLLVSLLFKMFFSVDSSSFCCISPLFFSSLLFVFILTCNLIAWYQHPLARYSHGATCFFMQFTSRIFFISLNCCVNVVGSLEKLARIDFRRHYQCYLAPCNKLFGSLIYFILSVLHRVLPTLKCTLKCVAVCL